MHDEEEWSPLAVLLRAMRAKWEQADIDGAVAIARVAAPFVHAQQRPGLARTGNDPELRLVSDAELSDRLAKARRRAKGQAQPADKSPRLGDGGAG